MDNQATTYEHAEIIQPGIIRLILLQPSSSPSAELECSLISTSLKDCDNDILEHYVALSYVWGDASLRGSILIDGKVLEITASLELALRYLRDDKRVLRIWADGICINQSDVKDRNAQVAVMGGIYSVARHTVIFLGPGKTEYESVLEMIANLGTVPESNFDQASLAESARDILVHPWFERVWILQELVLSIDPWVQIGRVRMRWGVFVHCMRGKGTASRSSTRSHLEAMSQIRAKYQTGKYSSTDSSEGVKISEILEARRGLGAADPRDMVYAHLGMSEPAVRFEIDIDYSKSVAQVYEDISRYFCRIRNDISFLSHMKDLGSDDRREGLPSWVPDWSIKWVSDQRLEAIFGMENNGLGMNLFHEVPRVLGIEGYYYGTVMDIFPRESFRQVSMEEILEWLSGIESLAFMQSIFASAIQLSKVQPHIHDRALGIELRYLDSVFNHLDPGHPFESETVESQTRRLFLIWLIDKICNEDVTVGKLCLIKSNTDLGLCYLPDRTLIDDIVATFSTHSNIAVFRSNVHETEPDYCETLREVFVREQHAQTTDAYSVEDLEVKPCKLVSSTRTVWNPQTSKYFPKHPQVYSLMATGENWKSNVNSLSENDSYMRGTKVIFAIH